MTIEQDFTQAVNARNELYILLSESLTQYYSDNLWNYLAKNDTFVGHGVYRRLLQERAVLLDYDSIDALVFYGLKAGWNEECRPYQDLLMLLGEAYLSARS